MLLFLSRDEGKHYILLPVSKIGIFRDHVAPPDFAENTDMAKDLDYKTGLDFLGSFFWEKSPSYRRINTVIHVIMVKACAKRGISGAALNLCSPTRAFTVSIQSCDMENENFSVFTATY